MIIKHSDTCYSVKFEKEDWYYYSTYTLNDFIKSIPKSYRRFDWNTKEWIVSNLYKNALNIIHFYTEEEESEGINELTSFLSAFDQVLPCI